MSLMRPNSIFILLVIVIFLSGCGGECKKKSDCESRTCYNVACVKKECDYSAIQNCCGNMNCETTAGENECICAKDCGACSEKESSSEFMTYFCNEKDKCVFGIDDSKINKTSIKSGDITSKIGMFEIDSVFNQPFNIDSDTFRVKISMKSEGKYVSNMVVKKIELSGQNTKRQNIVLGTAEVYRPIWEPGDTVEEIVIIDPEQSDKEALIKSMIITVYIDYNYNYGGSVSEDQSSFQYRYSPLTFTYVDPDTAPSCPPQSEWDDNNQGTNDICSSSTDYFVKHIVIPNACGNYRCEDSAAETECSCPDDCGPCSGLEGSYMIKQCNAERECIGVLKSGVTLSPNTIFEEPNLGYFKINTKITYDTPFNLNNVSSFNFEFQIKEINAEYASDITINDIRLLEQKTMLHEINIDKKLDESAYTASFFPQFHMNEYEDELKIVAKIWYQFTQHNPQTEATETKYGDYQINIGKLTFINPDE